MEGWSNGREIKSLLIGFVSQASLLACLSKCLVNKTLWMDLGEVKLNVEDHSRSTEQVKDVISSRREAFECVWGLDQSGGAP